jgi:hypothetical protein
MYQSKELPFVLGMPHKKIDVCLDNRMVF